MGTAHGYKDPSLAVSAAQAHGRAELAKTVSSRVAKRFQEAAIQTSSLVDGQPVAQKDGRGELEEVVDRSISGIRSEQIWASKSGTVYALMMLDEEQLTREIERANPSPTQPAPGPMPAAVIPVSAPRAAPITKPASHTTAPGSLDYR